jgi:hypothetical protein
VALAACVSASTRAGLGALTRCCCLSQKLLETIHVCVIYIAAAAVAAAAVAAMQSVAGADIVLVAAAFTVDAGSVI